jgi:hypothetical protein
MTLYGTLATKLRSISFKCTDAPPLGPMEVLDELQAKSECREP